MSKELDKEIEELESHVFGTPGQESTEEVKVETSAPEPVKETIAPVEESDQWEKRFKNYKASTDLTIRDLRSELAAAKTKIGNLQVEYSALVSKVSSSETPSSMFSEEDVEILGEPAVNALNKGVNEILEKKMKPLQEEVTKSRKELADREARDAQSLAMESYNKFIAKLAEVVPDFEAVNVSKGFLSYMEEPDEYSGYPRKYLFTKAEQALDVERIASFFTNYKKKIGPTKTDILDSAITPTGVQGATPAVSKDTETQTVVTRGFIDKFYDDYNRGKYRSKEGQKEAARIEKIIDKAVISGQVR
jgi:hypothetical protein